MATPSPVPRRKGQPTLKGRQVDAASVAEVESLLGDAPRARDLLIEHLHAIQDRFGHIAERHLAALAAEMKIPMAEAYEVATFYARFDVIADGEPAPAPITVRVCESLSCAMAGSEAIAKACAESAGTDVRVLRGPCIGRCAAAPAVEVGRAVVEQATAARVMSAAAAREVEPKIPEYVPLDDYRQEGGYALLQSCLDGAKSREDVIAAIDESGLRGLGGAGFPVGRKWKTVRAESGPRLFALNADEGEPGTFKDRYCLETDPHRVLEGMLIASWIIDAPDAYLYLRDEYPAAREILQAELHGLRAAGLIESEKNPVRVHLRRGAGAYICGEESAMLESLEGKRGYPRHKPPFPAQVGLFGRPTLIQNVETMFWVREILERGAAMWKAHGRHGRTGLRHISLSGRVKKPGVYRVDAGITVRELIAEHGGGMSDGQDFFAYLPGGASGGILPASLGDVPLDFDTLQPHGCFIGSAAVIVLSQLDATRDVVANLMHFFEDESCGQCTPCRNGTEKMVELLRRPQWDEPLLRELSACMMDASICGLGQAAPNPLLTVLRHWGAPK